MKDDDFFIRSNTTTINNYRWSDKNYKWHKISIYAGDFQVTLILTLHSWIFKNKWKADVEINQPLTFSNNTNSGLDFGFFLRLYIPWIKISISGYPAESQAIPF